MNVHFHQEGHHVGRQVNASPAAPYPPPDNTETLRGCHANTAHRQHRTLCALADLQSDTFAYGLPPIAWTVDETGTKVSGHLSTERPDNAAVFTAWRQHLATVRSLPVVDLAPSDRDELVWRARTTMDGGVMLLLSIAIER